MKKSMIIGLLALPLLGWCMARNAEAIFAASGFKTSNFNFKFPRIAFAFDTGNVCVPPPPELCGVLRPSPCCEPCDPCCPRVEQPCCPPFDHHDGYGHDGYGHDGYGHDGYGQYDAAPGYALPPEPEGAAWTRPPPFGPRKPCSSCGAAKAPHPAARRHQVAHQGNADGYWVYVPRQTAPLPNPPTSLRPIPGHNLVYIPPTGSVHRVMKPMVAPESPVAPVVNNYTYNYYGSRPPLAPNTRTRRGWGTGLISRN
jgi:hypothetical protein